MASFRVLYERLGSINSKRHDLIRELCFRMQSKLGDGWGVDSNPSDGLIIFDPDSNNYATSNLPDILKMPRDEAISEIMKCRCD